MPKYLLLKHYRGGRTPQGGNPVTPEEWDAHVQYMDDLADRLRETGEFVGSAALVEDGLWVRYDGEGNPPATDGPFAETKDLVAGWMLIDVDSEKRGLELAAELSAAPGANGAPVGEWLEFRRVMEPESTVTE